MWKSVGLLLGKNTLSAAQQHWFWEFWEEVQDAALPLQLHQGKVRLHIRKKKLFTEGLTGTRIVCPER